MASALHDQSGPVQRAEVEGSSDETTKSVLAQADAAPPLIGDRIGDPLDVWSRTEPKYRLRAVVLMLINLALFCGLCAFTYWLHVARVFDFSLGSYFEPAAFWSDGAPNLNDFLLFPISVRDVPLHSVVLGTLFASIIAVPMLVAMLYRFPAALPFVASVALFAHMPWLSLNLLFGCILCSLPPFRMRFRFASGIVGLLPVLAYLYVSTRGRPDQLPDAATPYEQALLVAPWLLAVLGALLLFAVVLIIARLVGYRPGAVAPVLAVMFVAPVMVFHLGVGVDELSYRILEAKYGPQSRLFEPVWPPHRTQARVWALVAASGEDPRFGEELYAVWRGDVQELRDRIIRRLWYEFQEDRAEAIAACEKFIADHPTSRYVPNALFMQARSIDLRLDRRLLFAEMRRELYADFPHTRSEPIWATLYFEYRGSKLAIAAAVRLAQLALRRGEVDAAAQLLSAALARADGAAAPTTAPARDVLEPPPASESLRYDPSPDWESARVLLALIESNRDDPTYGDAPLTAYASLAPRRASFHERLWTLIELFHDSKLGDNLAVAWAIILRDPQQRAANLETLVRRLPPGDALPEAMFRLADLETLTLAKDDPARREMGIRRFETLRARFPESPWAARAAERLALIGPAAPAATRATEAP